MRQFIDLISEAPLGDIHRPEFNPEQSSFRASDQKIIKSPKVESKWRRMFERCPYEIDLVFVDTGLESPFKDGVYDYDTIKERLPILPAARPDAIMLVLTNNEGANRVPLTPWIIAHRLGHAFTMGPAGNDLENMMSGLGFTLDDIIDTLYSGWEIPRISSVYALGKMRSCREHNLNSYVEFIFEVFAQFVITGKVTLNRFSKNTVFYQKDGAVFDLPHPFRDGDKFRESDLYTINDAIDGVERSFNTQIVRLLEKAKGRVVFL